MDWKEKIVTDPAILEGKPVIAGTRLAVEHVIELLANGWSEQDVIEHHKVSRDEVQACLAYAHDVLQDILVQPIPGASTTR